MQKFCKVKTIEDELECFSFTEGADWNGSYYLITRKFVVPSAIANSNREDTLCDWLSYLTDLREDTL